MQKIIFVSGLAAVLLLVLLSGGLHLGFPSWMKIEKTSDEGTKTVETPDALPSRAELEGALSLDLALTQGKILKKSSGIVHLVAELSAKEVLREQQQRPPLNLALVIDRSGSMESRQKMQRAKEAAKGIVSRLSSRDRVAIIAYSTDAEVLLSSREPRDREKIFHIIDEIEAVGATNLSEGLKKGKKEVLEHLSMDGINRVLLLSDGKANIGLKDPRKLGEFTADMARSGVSLSCLGLGHDFNEDLLVDMADFGRGNFYFIEHASQILDIFKRELRGLLTAVAKNVELTVMPRENVRVLRVYGYRPESGKTSVTVPLTSIASGQKRKIVFKLSVPSDETGPLELAQVTLDYENLISQKKVSKRVALGAEITADPVLVEASQSKKALARAEEVIAAESLEEAVSQVKARRDDEAARILEAQIDVTRARNRRYQDAHLNEQVRAMEGILDDIRAKRLDSSQRSIVVKQGKALSYNSMR